MTKTRRKPIRIKKSNAGKLRKTAGAKKGQKVPKKTLDKLARSKNPTTRRRAVFARNARRWAKKGSK
jgi:oligoendopeptidase F